MFARGLIVGKFYPPHRGHKYLIDTARTECTLLTVIVCWKPTEHISGSLRVAWLRKIHPEARVIGVEDTMLADDDPVGWAKFTHELLGFTPDIVFSSEAYLETYANLLGAQHRVVDEKRTHVPISATKVRGNPLECWEYLEPCVRGYFTKRVRVIGAESTGKTTLSMALAKHYATAWVPEYGGRMYAAGKLYVKSEPLWRSEEFLVIAREHAVLEDTLAECSTGLLISDTDVFSTAIWHERYLGVRSSEVEAIARSRPYDLTLLTGDEIPFEQDGTRDGEHIRHAMHQRFIERLAEEGMPTIVVTGNKEERLAQAISAIDSLLARAS